MAYYSTGEKEEEPLIQSTIPENFVDTGRIINGLFRTRNFFEGIIFAAPPAIYIYNLDIELEKRFIFLAISCGIIFGLSVLGINGDSITEFFIHMFSFVKRKRVAKYNPRVKREAAPTYLTKEEAQTSIVNKMRDAIGTNKNKEIDETHAISSDIYDPIYQEFFMDDLGYVDTPDDLKTKKELKAEAKERKRAEKERKRNEKMLVKANKKRGGK